MDTQKKIEEWKKSMGYIMTNRDKLLKSNEYDLLCRMNDALKEYKGWKPCILTAFGMDGFDRADRCKMYSNNCNECIRIWLNEESHFWKK